MASASKAATGHASAKVKRYTCLFTTDLHKKSKKWVDGYVRLHHYNSKLFILSEDQDVVAETFYQPSTFHARQRAYGTGESVVTTLRDDFLLEDGEELEVDGAFLAVIEGFEFESVTDVYELQKQVRQTRDKAAISASEWGSHDVDRPSNSKPLPSSRHTTSNTTAFTPSSSLAVTMPPAKPTPERAGNPSTLAYTAPPPAYKGFGVPPPRSYTEKSTKGSKLNPPSRFYSGGKIPSSLPKHLNSPSTPQAPYARGSLLAKVRDTPDAHVALMSPGASKAASSPFKPPSFSRGKGVVAGGKGPERSSSLLGERNRRTDEQ